MITDLEVSGTSVRNSLWSWVTSTSTM